MTPTTTPMPAWLESAWLARYLDRQLSGDEEAWFEAYLLDKPELLGMVEGDNSLRDVLATETVAGQSTVDADCARAATVDAEVSAEAVVSTHSSVRRTPSASSLPVRARPPAWFALAASLMIGLGVGGLGQRAFAPTAETESLIANPTRIVFDTLRGAPSAPEIERADSTSPYVLVEVGVPPDAEHIQLHVGDKQQAVLTQSPDGFVSFLVARASIDAVSMVEIRYQQGAQTTVREVPLSQLHSQGRTK